MGCAGSKQMTQIGIQTNETRESDFKYSGRLLPIEAGHEVTVAGKSLEKGDYFNIFLGSDDISDISLHITVDFKNNVISRNSYTVSEGWGKDETDKNVEVGNEANPIKPGEIFKLEIFVDKDRFHLTINSKPFCTFDHRLPIKNIHRINVYGAIEKIHQITHMTRKEISKALANESIVNIIPPTKLGSCLAFSGIPQGNENGIFEINLVDVITKKILLNLTVNFDTKKIIGKSQDENFKWCDEVVHDPTVFPFDINKMFKLAIGITSREFVISTDGHFSMKYPYQGELSDNPLKIEILSRDGLSMDVFAINNYSSNEKVNSKKVEFRKGWNPKKSEQKV